MKKISIICLAAFTLTFSSCEEHLELNSKDALSTQEALSTMGGVKSALVGMYSSMQSSNYYGRSLYIYGDLGASDVYISRANGNRYLSTFQKNYAANDADIASLWTAVYSTISRANNIINAVDAITGPAAEKNVAKGEALFIRALGYFDLVRIFAKPYNQGNGAQLGVPIVLASDISNYPSRNSVAEVYAQIIGDLNAAKGLLATTDATIKIRVSKYAASALLSRVYLYKGDNNNAINEANLVSANPAFVVTPAAALANFYSTPATAEEIFTLKFMPTESLGSNNLGAMYIKSGYGDIRISPDLVNTFDKVNDLRYNLFIGPFPGSPTEFQNNKFTSQDNINYMHSPKILRLAEVLLNRAEAYNKVGGKDAEALADLNAIRTKRGLPALVGIVGPALFDQILLERRHEFMFEGQRYFDLTRNGLAIQRNFCNDPLEITSPQCTLIATDPKTIAPIPQAELSANPALAGQQNTGY